ncbi:sigma-70 family RNA polymerase sigma factor [Ilyomonas limi]|uniref:Sigma-70 family RNA polymerase sigma factor n=1 Tax=Ilyomonas limi TaxID=2575867 RepID=A0A4U3KYQ5_9BACT|nr:sigma-70 family RNA polymerase sigma factor [Ilyomonas limi]
MKLYEEQAYRFLYDHYSKALFIVIKQIIPQQEIAEDILQETFVKVWQNIHTYDGSRGRLYTWMLSIARNLSIDRTRSKEFNKQSKTGALQENVYTSAPTEESRVTDVGLKKVLNSIPEENARLIDLAYFKGYTQEEIAKILVIPVGTVKTRMRSAIASLRKLIKPNV